MNHNRTRAADRIAREVFRKIHGKYPEHIVLSDHGWDNELIDKVLGSYRKTRCFCSGFCCGNPRGHYGQPTIQERKAAITAREFGL